MNSAPLTLKQLQLSIKSTLDERFPLAVWVSAEIADLKVNYSGHCYIELVEKEEGRSVASAQCRAVIWRSKYLALSSYFEAETSQRLGVGIKVLVKVLVSYHELYGMSLQINDINPSYTVGDAQRERQRTIAQLQKDGVWDMNRENPLPRLIQRIAIISSANAAGYQDFANELERSDYHFETTLFDAFMQGEGAEESIVSALDVIAESLEEFDVVVIIRGGGSVNDLRCFDGYRLCSHVAQFPIPIISGIGHDKDVSVVDMVSALSLKTPTAVAGFLTERMAQIEGWLESATSILYDFAQSITRNQELQLENYRSTIESSAKQLVMNEGRRIGIFEESLHQLCSQRIEAEKNRLEGISVALELYSPDHLLKLGYAVARFSDRVLTSCSDVEVGDAISLRLSDGVVGAEVTWK